MNTPTNKRFAGTKPSSPSTPLTSTNTSFILSPLASDCGTAQQRLENVLKQLLAWNEKWLAAHRRGTSLCTSIEAIKRRALDQKEKDKNVDLYPIDELKVHCNNLAVIMTIFEDVISNTKIFKNQLENLVQTDETKVFFKTWTTDRFLDATNAVLEAYEKEFQLKTIVKEDIAHGTTKSELAWHSVVWQYPSFVNSDVEFLLKSIKMEIS
ncbi:cyclin-dependent kinase 2-interacting protein [Culicoides brevitarsis]|uniref:cyclin-dependent kinase 2-interacting protein n=1 Tax=Culicoides brevitarsis TaxID=469753 RepID=UPI00307B8779